MLFALNVLITSMHKSLTWFWFRETSFCTFGKIVIFSLDPETMSIARSDFADDLTTTSLHAAALEIALDLSEMTDTLVPMVQLAFFW